jgi:hypothetical protein
VIIGAKASTRFRRRLASCFTAYVLVLQGFLMAASGVSLGAAAADGVLAIELCLHDVDAGDPPPQKHSDRDHCTLCVVCGHQLLVAPEPTSLWVLAARFAALPWPPQDPPAASLHGKFDHRPRGPPLEA